MAEQPPPEPEHRVGKFSCARDEALYLLAAESWSNDSSGDVSSPTGWFARLSNVENELEELVDVLGDDLAVIGVEPRSLLGHFLLVEDSLGFANVVQYESEPEVIGAFNELETVYQAWLNQLGGES